MTLVARNGDNGRFTIAIPEIRGMDVRVSTVAYTGSSIVRVSSATCVRVLYLASCVCIEGYGCKRSEFVLYHSGKCLLLLHSSASIFTKLKHIHRSTHTSDT